MATAALREQSSHARSGFPNDCCRAYGNESAVVGTAARGATSAEAGTEHRVRAATAGRRLRSRGRRVQGLVAGQVVLFDPCAGGADEGGEQRLLLGAMGREFGGGRVPRDAAFTPHALD